MFIGNLFTNRTPSKRLVNSCIYEPGLKCLSFRQYYLSLRPASSDNNIHPSVTSGVRQIGKSWYLYLSEMSSKRRSRWIFNGGRYCTFSLTRYRRSHSPIQCHVSITLPTGAEIVFVLDPLLHDIDHKRSSYQILPSRLDIHLVKLSRGQHWQYLDDGDQPEHLEPIFEPPSPSVVEDRECFGNVIYEKLSKHLHTDIPIQIMSDLHLELFFPRREGIGVQPGYHVFDCAPAARILALLGDIGLAVHGGLYDFLERQLHKYRHILFVIGNHEGFDSTYVSYFDLVHRSGTNFLSRITQEQSYRIFQVEYEPNDCLIRLWERSSCSIGLVMTSRKISPFLVVPFGHL